MRLSGTTIDLSWTELQIVDGLPLRRLPPDVVAPRQAAMAIATGLVDVAVDLRTARLFHNDLFPGNVLVSRDSAGRVALAVGGLDFVAPFPMEDTGWLATHVMAVRAALQDGDTAAADVLHDVATMLRAGRRDAARRTVGELPSDPD